MFEHESKLVSIDVKQITFDYIVSDHRVQKINFNAFQDFFFWFQILHNKPSQGSLIFKCETCLSLVVPIRRVA